MRWPLQAKMFLVFALVATIPLVAMSYLAVTHTRDTFREEVGRANLDSATTAGGFVDLYVETARGQLVAESRSPALRSALASDDQGRLLLEARAFHDRTSDEGSPLFATVLVVDANGTPLAQYPPEFPTETLTPAYLEARRLNQTVTMPPVVRGEAVLPMAAPVHLEGRVRGGLVVALSFRALESQLESFASRAGETLVLVGADQVLIHPEAPRARDAAWANAEPVRLATRGFTGYAEFDDPLTGERSLAGYAPTRETGWVVLSVETTSTAYASVTRLTAVLLVLAADLLVAMLLASVVVARAISRPLQQLTEAADAMAQGRLHTRIRIRRDDEVGELANAFNLMAERVGTNVEETRRSEERYRGLVESANDMIFTIEPDRKLSFVSALAERLLGDEPDALLGRPLTERVHPDDRAAFDAATSAVLTSGRPLAGVQSRLVHRDGTERVVLTNLSPVMTRLGVPGRVLGVSRDVTAERAQEALREQSFEMARAISEEAELAPLVRRGLDVILAAGGLQGGAVLIRQGSGLRIVAASEAPQVFAEVAERLAEEALAPSAAGPRHEASERPAPEALREHGVRALVTLPLIERAETLGLVVLLAPTDAALPEARRQVLGALASQLAVGIRRSLFEARLREYAAELESKVEERTALLVEKSQEMESFLYTVSHDLKAPLISIEGYAQGLEEDLGPRLDDEARHALGRIRKNAELMESLIGDLLEFSRIGRARDTVGHVEVDEVVREVTARFADAYAAAGGEVRIDGPLPAVHGERKRIAQVFDNLVGNALKYRHPERPPRVEVGARTDSSETVYHVRDNGRGIPPGAKEKAFQIFQRFPAAGLPDPGGTGIGLAIVKRIAETHGGRVWLETREGEGTTFYVALPLEQRTNGGSA